MHNVPDLRAAWELCSKLQSHYYQSEKMEASIFLFGGEGDDVWKNQLITADGLMPSVLVTVTDVGA